MDQTKSLHNLLEVADLIAMVEDLSNPDRIQEASPATWAGIRITLRNSRERILESHAQLSREVVHTARKSGASSSERPAKTSGIAERTKILTAEDEAIHLSEGSEASPPQRDLKSALERFVDR